MGVGRRWYCSTRRVRAGLRATAATREPTADRLALVPVLVGASRVMEVAGEFSISAGQPGGQAEERPAC